MGVKPAKKGGTVATRKRKGAYHHGDLRPALLAAALKVLTRDGESAFSLREVARVAGVTTGAPYHHFADRAELLATLAEGAFATLAEQLREAQDRAANPQAGIEAMARAYIDFARDQPVLYRVMWLPELGDLKRFATLHATSWRSMVQIVRAVSAATGEQPSEILPRAVAAWAACHGYATLLVDGTLESRPEFPPLDTLRDALARSVAVSVLAH
jgi:AcrR family transcriptional regulator